MKDIKDLESYGAITEWGEVIPHESKIIRKTYKDKSNQVCINIEKKTYRIKNLVAATFLHGWNSDSEEVKHIDGNKENNHYTNLEIVPIIDRYKITQEVADQIRQLNKAGHRKSALAKRFKVSNTTICKIINNQMWSNNNTTL